MLFASGDGGFLASAVSGSARAARLAQATAVQPGVATASASVVGPLFASYVLWVLRDVVARGGRTICFLARDGQVSAQMCQRLADWLGIDVGARYTLASRQAFLLAALPDDGDDNNARAGEQRSCGDTCLPRIGEFFTSPEAGIVDLGWRGTTQLRLQKVVSERVKLTGYYLGLTNRVLADGAQTRVWTTTINIKTALLEVMAAADHTTPAEAEAYGGFLHEADINHIHHREMAQPITRRDVARHVLDASSKGAATTWYAGSLARSPEHLVPRVIHGNLERALLLQARIQTRRRRRAAYRSAERSLAARVATPNRGRARGEF